ncbi:MAG: protein kinase [Muribaculaceae bacterium]|nr:protein kinase [Muribaculaceae bacterium]
MDDERIPTMPQAEDSLSERIPTMPQMEDGVSERIPTMPQMEDGVSERIPTMPQMEDGLSERVPTMPQGQADADGRVATMPQQGMTQNGVVGGRLIVTSDIHFTGDKGLSFVIESNHVVSADSGESQIYGCHKSIGNEKYVARILISVTPESDADKRLTRDKVIRFLDSISAKEDSHILPLIEHGTANINGKTYFVEIYPFCESGDLGRRKGQISYQELHDEIIPALNEALHLFHNAGLVHRDVKPDNLYRYNDKIVIGDFGITCDLRTDGFATDRYKTGTLGYYAPELMSQAAITSSDYYSFGQTIWTLYYGEMMYRNLLRRCKAYGIEEQRNQINFAMLNNVYYGLEEIRPEDAFFEILVRGLLQYDPSSRFGYEQVARWLRGDKSVAREIANFDSKGTFKTAFVYHGKECWDSNDIYNVLVEDWENAKELLYTGMLKDFFVSQDFGMSIEIDKIVKTYSTLRADNGRKVTDEEIETQNDIGLGKFFMLLNKGATLVWRATQYKNFEGLAAHIAQYIYNSDSGNANAHFTDLLGSDLLGYWYQYQTSGKGTFDEGIADVINHIRLLAGADSEWVQWIAYATTCYLFAGNSEALNFRECKTLNEIGKYVAELSGDFYAGVASVLTSAFFYGFLFASGYGEHAWYMINRIQNGRAYEDVEMLFDLFNAEIDDSEIKKAVMDCYLKKGPYAHLYWWKNHLELYSFHSAEADAIKTEIESCAVSGKDIQQLREGFARLEQLAIRFREMFVDNIFLASLGLNKGKNDITAEKAAAYWHYNFLDREAPIGFRLYIEEGGVNRG